MCDSGPFINKTFFAPFFSALQLETVHDSSDDNPILPFVVSSNKTLSAQVTFPAPDECPSTYQDFAVNDIDVLSEWVSNSRVTWSTVHAQTIIYLDSVRFLP